MQTHVVIMAGGIGSRLWPISTPERPKQFIDLLGIGKSLLQMTVDRFLPVCSIQNFWVVTSERYTGIVREQLPMVPAGHILAEPVARNTAPCIAYACWKIARECPDANIVVTPADALVINVEKFANVIRKALNFTVMDGRIVTVGIEPSRPETGYGYICAAERRPDEVVPVLSFKEKPDLETARGYLEAGNYFWNAGIFIWNVRTIMAQMRLHAPQIAGVMDRIAASFGSWKEEETVQELFPTCEKVSIDYAVMEKSDCISVIACNIGWSDLGSFSSIREHIPLPEGVMSNASAAAGAAASAAAGAGASAVAGAAAGAAESAAAGATQAVSRATAGLNKVVGRDVRTIGCEGCIIHAESMETVVAVGLKDYIVAVKDGNVLVCPLSEEQMIKEYSKPAPGKK